MTDLGKLLGEFARAHVYRRVFANSGVPQETLRLAEEQYDAARAALESHVAELRERAEKAEAAAQVLRDECAQMSEEFGLPPTIRPAEGEIRRLIERAQRTEKAEAKLARVREVLDLRACVTSRGLELRIREALGEP